MKISLCVLEPNTATDRVLVGIPDRELETLELVAHLSRRIDRVDEANRELEDGKENAQLGACRVAQVDGLDLVVVAPRPYCACVHDKSHQILDAEDVLSIEQGL